LLTYLISIPLGIAKARRDGTAFDVGPRRDYCRLCHSGFLFAVALIVFFAGGSYFDWFPLRGLVSEELARDEPLGRIGDYLWQYFPAGAGAEHWRLCHHQPAYQKRLSGRDSKAICHHGAGQGAERRPRAVRPCVPQCDADCHCRFPGAFIGAFFTGSLLIETIFSLDGLGLLSYESIINRDYPVVFASLYIFGLIGLW
jgi:microcin C transport system permease protein